MSNYNPTTEEIRFTYATNGAVLKDRAWDESVEDATRRLSSQFDRWLAAHDAVVLAAERERIIQDMQERSHPDDWGVPCVYIESYAERLRGEQR